MYYMIEIIRKRRSIRKFTEKNISDKDLTILKESVLRAPSSKNAKACEFIFSEDKKTIQKLANSKPFGSKFLEEATLAVVVLANKQKTEAWIEDSSVASSFLMLTAQALGLGTCWIQINGREHNQQLSAEEYTKQLLNIPADYGVLSIIAIGYPNQERKIINNEDLDWNKIHTNSFNSHNII